MRFLPAFALCLLAQTALAQTYMGMDKFVGPTAPATPTPPSANCPYGNSLGDGCPGALSTATQQTSGLFTSGPTNGQSYQTASFTGSVSGTTLTVSGVTGTINPNGHDTLLGSGITAGTTIVSGSGTTWTLSANLGTVGSEAMTSQFRPSWNVAGVDYPVGAPPANTLTDPSTLPVCSGSTFALCINGSVANEIDITAPNSGSNVVIDHYDFSLHGGYQLLLIYADTGNFTLSNSKFAAGTNFQSGGSIYNSVNGGNGSCGSTMLNSDNSAIHNIAGSVTITNVEFDGKADTGGSRVNCPGSDGTGGSPAVFNIWSTAPANSVIVTYSYFHDYNPRIQFAFGAVIKYSLFGANNYNTPAHGELTAFNESCGAETGCSGVSTIDMEYDTYLQSNAYCGGQTAPVFLGSGVNSSQITDFTGKNNTFITNGCQLNVSSNSSPSHAGCAGNSSDGAACQITFTTVDGGAGVISGADLCLTGNASTNLTCPAALTTQISGTTGGGGVWRYSGELTGSTNFSLILAFISAPAFFPTGETYRNIDSENNYIDPTGAGNFSINVLGDCATGTTASILHPPSGSITSSNNKWLAATFANGSLDESALAFTTCTKYAEGFATGTTSSSTFSPVVDSLFTGNINSSFANMLDVTAVTSGTIQLGATDTVGDSTGNVQRGTIITSAGTGSGGTGTYNITNPGQPAVTSEAMSALQVFGTINSGGRIDTFFGSGVGAGVTVTSGACNSTGCSTSYGLSSSVGSLSNRNFVFRVP